MAESVGTLLVKLDLDAADYHSKLSDAREGLAGFASGAAGMMASFAGGLIGGGIAELASHAVSAVKEFIVKGAEAADAMGKLGQRTGIPVEEMSRLAYAADLADVSTGQLANGLKALAKGMGEAASGENTKAAEALRAMGISAVDASGKLRPTAEVLRDVSDRFKTYEDGAAKSTLAVALFGRAGDQLIPMLNAGKEGLAEAGKELDAFGGTITPQAAAAGEAFNDNMKRLSYAGRGFALDVAGQVTPALAALTASFVSSAKEGGAMHAVAVLLAGAVKVLLTAVVVLTSAFEAVGKVIGGVAAAVSFVAQGEFRAAGRALLSAGEDLVGQASSTATRIAVMWDGAASEVERKSDATAEKIAAPLVASGKKVKEHADRTVKEIERARNALAGALASLDVRGAVAEAPKGHEEEAKIRARLDTGDLSKSLGKLDSAEAAKWRADLIAHAAALDAEKAALDDAKKSAREYEAAMRDGEAVTKANRTPAEAYAVEVARLDDLASRGAISFTTHERAVVKAGDAYRKAAIENDAFLKSLDAGWKKFQAGFEDSVVNVMTGKFKGGLSAMLSSWGDMLRDMIARAIAAKITSSIFGAFGGGPAGLLSGGGGAQAKAAGGTVDRGSLYLVGERGPELFVPGASGSIVPNDAIAGKGAGGELTVRIPDLDRLGRVTIREVVEGYLSDLAAERGTA